ncbi:MAG: fimbrillin family protein [Bacteroidales bacterium]|nr:fimbrillin family protein [Bacteroidales bacterium]
MKSHFFLIALSALTLSACSHLDNPVEESVPIALSYSTVQITGTKAAQNLNDGTFASGETVKVMVSKTGEGNWAGYDFTTGESGTMIAPNPGPYYPAGSTNIDISAYYPSSAGTSFTVKSDQTADSDYKASDLMFASVTDQAKQTSPVELVFSHKLVKINVNITAGSGIESITGVSILNVKPTVSFNQTTGAVETVSGAVGDIEMSNNGAAVIPAQVVDGDFLSIVTDKGTAIYSVSGKEFLGGHQYTINITVNLRAVGATTAITGWTSEGTVNVYPVADPLTVLNVTSEHLGWIITTDGYVYQNKAAVDAAGKTASALIFYIGEPGTADASNPEFKGLAMSLIADYGNWATTAPGIYCLKNQYTTYTQVIEDMNGIQNTQILQSHDHPSPGHFAVDVLLSFGVQAPVGTSGWFLGTVAQWVKYITGMCGVTVAASSSGYGYASGGVPSLNAPFVQAGYPDAFYVGSAYSTNRYWTSCESYNESNASVAWGIELNYDYPNLYIIDDDKKKAGYIRPFVAF